MEEKKHYEPLYVLNNFMKFERKFYQFASIKLGRPIKMKTLVYFLIIGVLFAIWYITPVINVFIRWIPFSVLIVIVGSLAWLLTDISTEGRTPMKFFRSFIAYQLRKRKKVTIYKGKEIKRPQNYDVSGFLQCIPSTEKMQIPSALLSLVPMKEKEEATKSTTEDVLNQMYHTKQKLETRTEETKPIESDFTMAESASLEEVVTEETNVQEYAVQIFKRYLPSVTSAQEEINSHESDKTYEIERRGIRDLVAAQLTGTKKFAVPEVKKEINEKEHMPVILSHVKATIDKGKKINRFRKRMKARSK